MKKIQFGIHVNRENNSDKKTNSITKCIQNSILHASAYNLNMNIVSIFISNPRGLQIILKDDELMEFQQWVQSNHFLVVAHSSYVAYLWNKDDPDKYIDFVLKEYNVCKQCGIKGLVVHLPKESILKKKHIKQTFLKLSLFIKKEKSDVLGGMLVDNTSKIWYVRQEPENKIINGGDSGDSTSPSIYLETPAITPMWANYDTPKKLSKLFHIIHKIDKDHPFGLCIDTAHIWTSGNNISTYNGAKRWFTELMYAPYIPPPNRILIHLNDSARELGRGPDKHAPLTHGYIWGEYKTRNELKKSGLYFILQFSEKYNIPIILERGDKNMLIEDYKILSKII